MDQTKPTFVIQRVRVVVDKLLFRFSICRSVPGIFTIKVESCQKSRRILDDFFCSSPEVIDSNKLNFRPHVKFSRLKFVGVPAPLGVCASRPW